LVVYLFLAASLAYGQSSPTIVAETPSARLPKLSPGAEEMARTLGVLDLINRFCNLPAGERGLAGGVMTMEALSLRQEITESIVGASLEVDGLLSEIDNEVDRIVMIRTQLGAHRDRALAISNLAAIIAGGATGVLGTGLQFSDSTSQAGNAIGVAGGAVSTTLSLISLHQQHGGKLPLGNAPNMLARIFDRQEEFHSEYPQEVWTYLNAVPPSDPAHGTRREQLIKQWTDAGRIEAHTTAKAQAKIELLTSGVSNQRPLTIELLDDRAAMLADVRAVVSLMKRDLSKLVLALRS